MEEYRNLETGEIIAGGDEWWDEEDEAWLPIVHTVGRSFDSEGGSFIVRRKVYTAPTVTYEAPIEARAGTPVGVDPLGLSNLDQ